MAVPGELREAQPLPATAPRTTSLKPIISAPPSQLQYPSSLQTRSSPMTPGTPRSTPRTPNRFMTPLASPMKKAVAGMRDYMEDVEHLRRLDPEDAWLPITESRNGNACYAAFHILCSGIGFQALLLPVAFASLGWTWGVLSLSLAFMWQLYTLWILTQLHECTDGTRNSRYLPLCMVAFGDKLGKCLAKFPTMYLSAGTCTALILTGGGSMKLFFEIVCGPTCESKPLTTIEWYLAFVCLATVIAQLPNLNAIAGVSLIGSITAVSYCTIIWVLSVAEGRPAGVSYQTIAMKSEVDRILSILNGLGIVAFAFRGHNLVLEIQATMPSTQKQPSHVPMWKGVTFAYTIIACCLFPVAIAGYWAYGNLIPPSGILCALHKFHGQDTSNAVLGLTTLIVMINCLSSFQIYAMPVFDNLEAVYTSRKNKPCPKWLRSGIRIFFSSVAFLISVAFPFLPDLAGLLGGIALPVTLAYPCFMWIIIKKPKRYSFIWNTNIVLGVLGITLSVLLIVGGIWSIVVQGLNVRFFRPHH